MVSGWRELDEHLDSDGSYDEVDGLAVEPMGDYGCSCGWQTTNRNDFEAIGIDGEPLPVVHPSQLEISS